VFVIRYHFQQDLIFVGSRIGVENFLCFWGWFKAEKGKRELVFAVLGQKMKCLTGKQ